MAGIGVSFDRSGKGRRASRAVEREADRARSSVVRGPWFVVKESGGR